MAEEEKKAKKPRSVKKTGAGTGSAEEKQVVVTEKETPAQAAEGKPKAKRATGKKTASVQEAPAQPTAENGEKKVKKAPAKKTAKKQAAEEIAPAAAVEAAVAPEAAEAEKPVKRTRRTPAKKAAATAEETASAKTTVASEAVVETTVAPEAVAPEAVAPEAVAPVAAVEETPVKKTRKAPAKKAVKKTAEEPAPAAATAEPVEGEKPAPKKAAKEEKAPVLTKAEKKDAIKKIVRELLHEERKWSDLIDRTAHEYQEAFPIPENSNVNDVRGRVGSVLHLMQEEHEIVLEGSVVHLPVQEDGASASTPAAEEEVAPKKEEKTGNEPTVSAVNEPATVAEKPENAAEAPVASADTSLQRVEAKTPAPVYDMSLLFGDRRSDKKKAPPVREAVEAASQQRNEEIAATKPVKTEEKPAVTEERTVEKKAEEKHAVTAKKPVERKAAEKPVRKEVPTRRMARTGKVDPLKDEFLKKLRSLGGNYFEYYSIYLLERYSRMNGRRLEGLRISGGEHDGGIDGELELTDRLGFRETIYVQAKNWEPTDERWYIGETILQQFIGAVAYRQAQEGKQHCRGMFITTSTFTTGAKEMLEKMSDKFVGYDGDDLFETAKECEFGLLKDGKGGWKLDEELLGGKKSFFFML